MGILCRPEPTGRILKAWPPRPRGCVCRAKPCRRAGRRTLPQLLGSCEAVGGLWAAASTSMYLLARAVYSEANLACRIVPTSAIDHEPTSPGALLVQVRVRPSAINQPPPSWRLQRARPRPQPRPQPRRPGRLPARQLQRRWSAPPLAPIQHPPMHLTRPPSTPCRLQPAGPPGNYVSRQKFLSTSFRGACPPRPHASPPTPNRAATHPVASITPLPCPLSPPPPSFRAASSAP